MPRSLVYIIVLNWNRKKDTIACLESLLKTEYSNYTIVLVDNASSDGTVAEVREKFPSVNVIANAENLRFAGGNNVGIEHALLNGADYVVLLNNDTIVDPAFLAELVQAAENDASIGIAGPKIYYYDQPKMIWYAGGKVEYWKGWISHVGIREQDNGQYNVARDVDYVTGCCMLVKREVIERIGKLDESFFIYGEDADWSLRAARAGFRLRYVPSSMIWHKVSASSGGNLSWFKNWNKLKGQLRLMARYAKWYNWLTIPFGVFSNILLSAYKARKPAGNS